MSKIQRRDVLYNRQRSDIVREIVFLRLGRAPLKPRPRGWSGQVSNATLARWVRLLKADR